VHNILYTTSHILYLEQQQMYAMRYTTVAPVEAGSHLGCQRQLSGTVAAEVKRKYVQY